MTAATAVGSMPGLDQHEALRIVLGELPDLPHLPELPERGVSAAMTGRSLAVLEDLGVDLQPAGWRLVGGATASGADHRRARSLLGQDLDVLEEQTQGLTGALKIQVAGPWTLAATVEKPRGDRVLSDVGARRELAQALAEGVRTHVRDVRRRVPGVERLVVQVDEPALAAVLAGRVPTASGFGRHRTVDRPEASQVLGWLLSAIAEEGAEPWVHACAPGTPWDLVRGAGARGISADLSVLSAVDHDVLAEAFEAGEVVALGVVPAIEPSVAPTERELVETVLRWLDLVGLEPGPGLLVTPSCGLAGAGPGWTRTALALTRTSAAALRSG